MGLVYSWREIIQWSPIVECDSSALTHDGVLKQSCKVLQSVRPASVSHKGQAVSLTPLG